MYPRNNASPERLAIGQVILISDGTIQTSAVVITVRGQGGAEATGGGTTVYGAEGTVYYTPTQAETNYTSFVVIASKASCFSASLTVVTTASSTAGQVDVKSVAGTAQTANDNGADINAILLDTAEIGTAGAGLTALATAANLATVDTVVDGIQTDLSNATDGLGAIKTAVDSRMAEASINTTAGAVDNVTLVATTTTNTDMRGTDNAATAASLATAQTDLDTITDTDGVILGAAGVDLIWDESLAAHQTVLSAGRAMTLGGVPIAETTATGTPTTTTIQIVAGSTTDSVYNDATVRILSGAGVGQARIITSYVGATKTCNFDEAFTIAPSSGDAVAISMDHIHPVVQIQAGLATEAKQDIIDTNVDTLNTNVPDVISLAAINAEVDTALADYDGPTNAEMEARTPTAAQLAYIVENAATGKPVTFSGTGTTTSGTMALVDGTTPNATNDQYKGRLLVFNAGTLDEAVTDITAYNGTTKACTVTAVPFAITSAHTARLI